MARCHLFVFSSAALCLLSGLSAAEIHDALERGEIERAKKLLQADPAAATAKAEYGVTTLHIAAKKGLKDIVKLLVEKGVDVNVRDDVGDTPLHTAAAYGQNDVIKLLLSNKANVNAESRFGATPLHRAALMGHKEAAALLLAAHAEVNAKNARGQTPLDLALTTDPPEVKGRADAAALLLKHGGKTGAEIK